MLVIILILAAFLRFTNLGEIPYMFDGDETYFGYYSYSLANFGSDEFANPLPLYFSSIGDFKYPLYAYLGAVWVRLFGLSPVSTRFTSAVSGVLAVALIAVITGYLTRNKKLSLYSAWFLTLSPWHIWMSRRALEANLGFTLILLAVSVFLKKWWVLTFLFSGLAMFSYPASRIFVIGLAFLGFGYFLIKRKPAEVLTSLFILVLGSVLFLSPQSRARGSDITIWNPGNIAAIQKQVSLDIHADGLINPNVPIVISRLLHNKLFYLVKDIADKALSHFDPTYLFVSGESRDRYSIPRMGLLTYAEGLLLLTGLFYLFLKNKKLWFLAVGWWLLAAASPAITTEPVHSVRYSLAIAAVVFISAWGLYTLNFKLKLLATAALCLNFLYFWHQYTVQKTFLHPWYLEAEMQSLPRLVSSHQQDFTAVSLPGDAYIYFLFYQKTPPSDFLNASAIDPDKFKWDRVNRFGKITFKMSSPCPKIGKLHVLYMCIGSEIPQNAQIVELARFRDGVPAYSLIQFLPISQITDSPLPAGIHRMVESDFRFNSDGLLPEDYPGLWL